MGLFDFIESIPLIGGAVKKVRETVAPIVKRVSDFAAPLWNAGKRVAKFIPGASEAMEGIEAIGSDFIEGATNDAEEASKEIEETGQRTAGEIGRGYQRLKKRGNDFVSRTAGQWDKMKRIGRDFTTTVQNPNSWRQHYSPDNDEDEQPRRRTTRTRRRRQPVVLDEELD